MIFKLDKDFVFIFLILNLCEMNVGILYNFEENSIFCEISEDAVQLLIAYNIICLQRRNSMINMLWHGYCNTWELCHSGETISLTKKQKRMKNL